MFEIFQSVLIGGSGLVTFMSQKRAGFTWRFTENVEVYLFPLFNVRTQNLKVFREEVLCFCHWYGPLTTELNLNIWPRNFEARDIRRLNVFFFYVSLWEIVDVLFRSIQIYQFIFAVVVKCWLEDDWCSSSWGAVVLSRDLTWQMWVFALFSSQSCDRDIWQVVVMGSTSSW